MKSDQRNSTSFIDPIALLDAHQEARGRNIRILSTICGPRGTSRAVWGRWIGHKEGMGKSWGGCVVSSGASVSEADRVLKFARANDESPLLFVPANDQFPAAFACADEIGRENPRRPVALVTEPVAVMDFLQGGDRDTNSENGLRMALVGGLVVLDRQVESLLNRSVLRNDERPLYRSDQEQILHKLLVHDTDIAEEFFPNRRVRGGSLKAYEIDLWCPDLELALEVDGGQHVSDAKQRKKDADRDADLAKAGIRTIRIHAAEIISDPSSVLIYVRDQIKTARKRRNL